MVSELQARAAARRARFVQTVGSGAAPFSGTCSGFRNADRARSWRQDRDSHPCIPTPDTMWFHGADSTVRHHVAGRHIQRTCNWLGLDVHDVGLDEMGGAPRPLEPDRLLTVEPGIHVTVDQVSAPAACHGMGARFENDVLVSPTDAQAPNATAVSTERREIEAPRTITAAAS